MVDSTADGVPPARQAASPHVPQAPTGPLLAADGTPLKRSLARALRREKLRALMLIAPLLLFVLLTFIAPIADMLFRSVENGIVPDTLPRTVVALQDWDERSDQAPGEPVFAAIYNDLFLAAEAKEHTRLGSRLNYEASGMSSLFRSSGRRLDDIGKDYQRALKAIAPEWDDRAFWYALMAPGTDEPAAEAIASDAWARIDALTGEDYDGTSDFVPAARVASILPRTTEAYTDFALFTALVDEKEIAKTKPWESVHVALVQDLEDPALRAGIDAYSGPGEDAISATLDKADELPPVDLRAALIDADEDWQAPEVWQTIKRLSGAYTSSYFLSAVDMETGPDGVQMKPDDEQIYQMLFGRTLVLSVTITFTCLLLGYPVAYLLSTIRTSTSNLLLILVLLPFWTSLLVRTSSWIVLLQQQGVLNDTLVAIGIVSDDDRLSMMFNETGTVVAMTHILLPFMILPLYSVMKTINPSYVRAAKSLGATDWTAFWRVYFPQSIPGIGAGAILVFILAIGYYITPELVGGTSGIFISNRIAYHISSSLNWGLAAALGVILLGAVLILYWTYDRIVGIDNVKLG